VSRVVVTKSVVEENRILALFWIRSKPLQGAKLREKLSMVIQMSYALPDKAQQKV
jgi:hypothetical protein